MTSGSRAERTRRLCDTVYWCRKDGSLWFWFSSVGLDTWCQVPRWWDRAYPEATLLELAMLWLDKCYAGWCPIDLSNVAMMVRTEPWESPFIRSPVAKHQGKGRK